MEASHPIRVMVVDDHPVVREGFSGMISTEPDMLLVAQARNGAQAVEMFRLHRPDVTLMDLRMPGMNGADTIAAIRSESATGRFIVLTTDDSEEDLPAALRVGAQAYLRKDAPCSRLLEAIRRVFDPPR